MVLKRTKFFDQLHHLERSWTMDMIRKHLADRRSGLLYVRVDVCLCGSTGPTWTPYVGQPEKEGRCSIIAFFWPPSVLKQGLAFSGGKITLRLQA